MLHFVYKTYSDSGRYYIGRHSTENINDGYFGSGKWVRSLKDKSQLNREILEICNSFEDLLIKEKIHILSHINNENCMNFNNNPIGFATGNLNPNTTLEAKQRLRTRALENNPTKSPETRKKMSESQKGKTYPERQGVPLSDQHKDNISKGRTGIQYSSDGKVKLSEARKKQWNGSQPSQLGHDIGEWKHSSESKNKLSEARKNTPKQTCAHCKKEVAPNLIKRWHNDNCKQRNN
jgi:hypothetical protein